MTQTFTNILPTDNVGQSLDPIKDRDQANKTNFMGTSLPAVTADDIGMQAVVIKTENDILYRQVWRLVAYQDNQPSWQLERDLTRGLVYSNNSEDASIANYQPENTLLTSLAAQTAGSGQSNANKFPYLSATNTVSLSSITALARTFLAAADAATARSTLGLGSLATKNSVSSSDIGANTVQLSNLAKGTYNKIISYNASGNPVLVDKPAGVPVGTIIMYPSTVLPDNSWIFCYGQQLTKADYSELWTFASTSNNLVSSATDWANRPGSFYQVSSTVFKVPDLRNYFIRVWDGPTGPTRVIGSKQADANKSHTHKLVTSDGTPYGMVKPTETSTVAWGSSGGRGNGDYGLGPSSGSLTPTLGVSGSSGESESRPINIALPFIMKARSQTV